MSISLSKNLSIKPRFADQKPVHVIANGLKISPRKLSLVTRLIAGKIVSDALNQLDFCLKGGARIVKKALLSAVANAQNNFGFDIDKLIVGDVVVGKSITLKRPMPKARGRGARILKRYSYLRLCLFVVEGLDGTKS